MSSTSKPPAHSADLSRKPREITLDDAKAALERAQNSGERLMTPWEVMVYLYDAREMSSGVDTDCCGVVNAFVKAFVGSTFNTQLIQRTFEREEADLIAPWMMLVADEVMAMSAN